MPPAAERSAGNNLTLWILGGLLLGLACGAALHAWVPDTSAWVQGFTVVTTLFLRLIKMVIAPLVFATLVVGIAKMGDTGSVGRIGLKAFLWFVCASLASLSLGLVLVNFFEPGVNAGITLPETGASSGITTTQFGLQEFILHLVPVSIVDGMARNEILQIVVFSVFFGVACAGVGKPAAVLVEALEGLSYVMLKLTMLVMWFAPLAVFAAVASAVAKSGLGILAVYGEFMLEFYLSILVLWVVLFVAAWAVIGRRAAGLFRAVREPVVLAFATASSEAAYPRTLAQLERFGCSNRVASFVLPLGYSFNLDGTSLYMTLATLFVAQATDTPLALRDELTVLAVLLVTSKGAAGVTGSGFVTLAATLAAIPAIPASGLALLLGVDRFLSEARALTNFVGNAVATLTIARLDGSLDRAKLREALGG